MNDLLRFRDSLDDLDLFKYCVWIIVRLMSSSLHNDEVFGKILNCHRKLCDYFLSTATTSSGAML